MLGKIRRHHCKERLKISTIAKFESNLLKFNGDRAPELRNFSDVLSGWSLIGWGVSLRAQFSQPLRSYIFRLGLATLRFSNTYLSINTRSRQYPSAMNIRETVSCTWCRFYGNKRRKVMYRSA